MSFRSLRILDRFKFLFTKFDVDYSAMRKILELKLTMDSRRIPTVLKDKKTSSLDYIDDGNKMLKSLWMYAMLSLMPGVLSIMPIPIFGKVSFIMGISMFLVMSTMISDFSSVLLDIRDKNILMTLPVSAKTLSAAKTVHIIIYLTMITFCLNIAPLIGLAFNEGILASLLLLFMLCFMVMTVIFFTSLLYVFILKNFDGEKLKDLISSIQIVLTISITLGYQMIAHMYDFTDLNLHFTPKWWTLLLPPAWFAAPFALISGERSMVYMTLTILGVVMPILFIYLHTQVISPIFEQNLSKLNSSGTGASKAYFRRLKTRGHLAKLLCKSSDEQATFKFGYSVLSSERELKQKVYPSMALSILFPFILGMTFLEDYESTSEALAAFRNSKSYLWVYFSVMILPTIIMFIKNSQHYKGAWIYRSLPIENPKALLSGTFKSAIIRFGMLPYIFTATLMLLMYGPFVLPHLIIAFLNTIYLVLFILRTEGIILPFSRSFQVSQDGHMKGTMLGMFFAGLLAGLHYLLTLSSSTVPLIAVLLIQSIGLIPLWKNTLQINWSDLKS